MLVNYTKRLPDEVQAKILTEASANSWANLGTIETVCKSWNKIVNSDSDTFWKHATLVKHRLYLPLKDIKQWLAKTSVFGTKINACGMKEINRGHHTNEYLTEEQG